MNARLAFTIREVAEMLGVSKRTVYRLIRAGSLPVVELTPGGHKRIAVRSLDKLLAGGKRGAA